MVAAKVMVKEYSLKGEMDYKNQSILTYDIRYPQFASDKFKSIIQKLNIYYKADASLYLKFHVNKLFHMAIDDYEYAVSQGYPVRQYEVMVENVVTYNNDCVLSLYFDRYEYTAGAHGMTYRSSDTWNLQKGRRMDLAAFFPDKINYREYIIGEINRQIEKNIEDGNEYYFDDTKALVEENFNEKNFYLVPEGVMIYYQLYEIAPYVSGIQTFLIPFAKGAATRPRC